ncbi:MAG: FAD binding domain-containing protein, partial [Kiloniellales bacterium]|nr:FAD binding domain-containing protein [Kiloniellales bacterium]
MEELLHLRKRYPNALLTAGMTDVGLWITKQHRRFDRIISLCEVAELRDISEKDGWLEIGAAVTYSEAFDTISGYWPDFGELLRRLGSVQIRNCGTIGGNVANGSPIGDSPPPLIALGAEVCLRSLRGERILPLEDFFVEYGKQDLRKGEILAQVRVPLPKTRDTFRCYKLSKRFDQDISALCGAYRFRLGRDGIARDVRIAYGGMAGVPQRALKAETAIEGKPWTEGTLRDAIAAVAEDFSPLSDWRASAGYRQRAAANLLKRFYLETSGEAKLTRVLDSEVLAHG